MPKLTDTSMETIKTNSNYGFSAAKISDLGATEYTLVSIVLDKSGSLNGYERDLEKMMIETLNSCKKSPRAENLMVRTVLFSSKEDELHGFRILSTIEESEYNNAVVTGGTTDLYGSVFNSIESTLAYSKALIAQDYLANAIVFVITDGCDNENNATPDMIKKAIEESKKSESIESLAVVLIGMTGDSSVKSELQDFQTKVGITQYIDMGDVSPSKLAKLAGYISKSVSSTSQALGTGGVSKSLTF